MQKIKLTIAIAGIAGLAVAGVVLKASLLKDECVSNASPTSSGVQIPIVFEPNLGQTDDSVRFLARGKGHTLFLTDDAAVLASGTTSIRMNFPGSKPNPEVQGDGLLGGKSNYLMGQNPDGWKRDIPHYSKVIYDELYPGIDLVFFVTSERRFEYDFEIASGSDPSLIKMSFEGSSDMKIDNDGNVILKSDDREVKIKAPIAYQMRDGKKREVSVSFKSSGLNALGFEVGQYDITKTLIIDPVLVFSTCLGGSFSDGGAGIAVDGNGRIYIVGNTSSIDFPLKDAIYGSGSIFVTKIESEGAGIVYSTYIGALAGALASAVDDSGNVYITGMLGEIGSIPIVNAFQGTPGGWEDAFVMKLNSSGSSLDYSSYLGGSNDETARDMVIDSSGNAYIVGHTKSTDFPIKDAFQSSNASPDWYDFFITKVAPSGSSLVFSTYLGGSGFDFGRGIGIDSTGNVYVVGETGSVDFPTATPYQGSLDGGKDVAIAKFDSSGSILAFSTFFGGSGLEEGYRIAIDNSSNIYITGATRSSDFPTINAYQGALAGIWDVFISKFTSDGSTLLYSTYLGGSLDSSGGEVPKAIEVDLLGQVHVTGTTPATDFPIVDAFQAAYGGGDWDTFIMKLSADGSALVFSSFLGGSKTDTVGDLCLDDTGYIYVTGGTTSSDFPIVNGGGYLGIYPDSDAFISKVGPTYTITQTITPSASITSTATSTRSFTITPTATISPTQTETATPTHSPTHTPSRTWTSTHTHSPTFTPTSTITWTSTISPTPSHSSTSTVSPTITETFTITPTLTITLVYTPTVSEMLVSPNPVIFSINKKLSFMGLPEKAEVKIYTIVGELVRKLEGENGSAYWDGKTKGGSTVAAGVYIYVITRKRISGAGFFDRPDQMGKIEKHGRIMVLK